MTKASKIVKPQNIGNDDLPVTHRVASEAVPDLLREGCQPRCPGCAHRTLSASQSQAQKHRWLRNRLKPWQEKLTPLKAPAAPRRWAYRDRVCLSTAWQDGGWRFGLVQRNALITIPNCPIHTPRVRAAIELLCTTLPPPPEFPLAFFVQSGAQTTLVLRTARLPDLGWLDKSVWTRLQEIGLEGLWLHLHPCAGRRIFLKRGWHLVWGEPASRDENGLIYGPTAFQQLIGELYREALDEAQTFLQPSMNDTLVDLYCGSVYSLVLWTRRGARTLGVELGADAVRCAQRNAPLALILRGACRTRIPQLDTWAVEATEQVGARLLYANPPRTGIEPEVLDWICERFRPERIAYLSCSAGTLCRDLERLQEGDYRVEVITPYDFFPQTYHVETLVLLRRVA